MSMLSLSDPREYIWYPKPTLLNQPIFAFPMIGFINGMQAAVVVIGIVGMFLMIGQVPGDQLFLAGMPVVAAIVFAMIRPPVMGHEERLFHILRFMISGPKYKEAKKKGPRPKAYRLAKRAVQKPTAKEAEVAGREEVIHLVPTDRPLIFKITLRTPLGEILREPIRVKIDGVERMTQTPDHEGIITVHMFADECAGTKIVTMHQVKNGKTGAVLNTKKFIFE